MRNLVRMSAASVLLMLALTFAPKTAETNNCYNCWESGGCTYCVDSCTGNCVYACPWGDGYC